MKITSWGRFRAEAEQLDELTQVVRRDRERGQVLMGYWLPEAALARNREAFETQILASILEEAKSAPEIAQIKAEAEIITLEADDEEPLNMIEAGYGLGGQDAPEDDPGPAFVSIRTPDDVRALVSPLRTSRPFEFRPVPKPTTSKPRRRGRP